MFSLFGKFPPQWRAKLRASSLHTAYLRMVKPLSKGLTEQEFKISAGPLTGYRVLLSPDRWERRYLFGEYEPDMVNTITEYCSPGMVVLDIGAHYGYFSLLMAKLVAPNGRCMAFEPSVENHEHIQYALRTNNITNLDIYNVAMGDFNGSTEFALDESGFMGHLVGRGGGSFQASQTYSVPVRTLDEFLDELNIGPIDLMKIDVEGAEDAVIAGALDRIQSDRPLLIIEVHQFLPPEVHAQPFLRRLVDLDYEIVDIVSRQGISIETFKGGHIIACPRP